MFDIDILRQMDLFWGMNDKELELFKQIASEEKFPANQIIFREGDECDKLYIVASGSVEISTQLPDGSNKILGTIYPKTQFGEMALIDDAPRAATAKTLEDTVLFSVLRDDFLDLIEQHPTFAAKALINLARTLSKHLRTTNELLRKSVDWNLKISGAGEINLDKLITENHHIRVRLHDHEEIKGVLLKIERGALGCQLTIEDDTGQIFIVPSHAIIYITTVPQVAAFPLEWS